MFGKLFFAFLLFTLSFVSVVAQTGETLTGSENTETITSITSTSSSGIFSLYNKVQTEKLKVSEIQANRDYEIEFQKTTELQKQQYQKTSQDIAKFIGENPLAMSGSFIVSPEIELRMKELLEETQKLLPEITDIVLSPAYFQKNAEILTLLLQEKQKEMRDLIEESQIKLTQYQSDFESQQAEFEKTQISFDRIIKDWLKKGLYFILAIIVLFLLAKMSAYIIQRKSHLSEEKKQVILSLLSVMRNTAIIIVVVVFFFSELLNFLPALAILGTAIGFALRDVISSFIAWFVIGLRDTTYKIGDVIEIPRDQIFGEVVKIHPLVTTIKELGLSGPNSKFRSFPNKLIFETSLNNLWKYSGWTYIPIESMITYDSDMNEAKQLLLDAMNEVYDRGDFSRAIDQKAKLRKLGLQEKNIIPQVFIDVRTQGVFLRGKILVMWNERHEMRNQVVALFMQKMKTSETVHLRYVDFWVNELR